MAKPSLTARRDLRIMCDEDGLIAAKDGAYPVTLAEAHLAVANHVKFCLAPVTTYEFTGDDWKPVIGA